MSLKSKFALWEQKAKKDTPKGPCARPQSSMSMRGAQNDNVSVVSAAATDIGPFGPVKKKKKKPAVLDKIEQARDEINGRITKDLGKVDQERKDAEQRRLEEKRLAEEDSKKMLDRKNSVQNWVNNIAEDNESDSTSSGSPVAPKNKPMRKLPPQQPKQPITTQTPPKVKQKYTTTGRRTSSMSGIEIHKKVDLARLPQPADLSVPFVKEKALKKTPLKTVVPALVEQHDSPDWSIVDLQQGFDSEETSSYEMIEPIIEVEEGYEQVFRVFCSRVCPVVPGCFCS